MMSDPTKHLTATLPTTSWRISASDPSNLWFSQYSTIIQRQPRTSPSRRRSRQRTSSTA